MRLSAISCGIAALLSASTVLAQTLPTPTASPTFDEYRAQTTPFPELVEDESHLEIRQNLGVIPDAEQAPGQVPPVTIYTIATQIGATGVVTQLTFTQLFSNVPDQWPSPKAGTIGLGTLQKRAAEPAITGSVSYLDIEQPVVLVQEVEIVTMPLQKVTEVLVVENVVVSNMTGINGTAQARNGSLTAANSVGYRPLYTAASAGRGVFPTGTMR